MLKFVDEKTLADQIGISVAKLRYDRSPKGTIKIPHYKIGQHVKYDIHEVFKYLKGEPFRK